MSMKTQIAIVGAGPAGLIAAETLAKAHIGAQITLYDKMPSPARKFLLAGRGGLNLTHSKPLPDFLSAYHEAAPHLAPALAAFSPQDLQDWAAELGEPCFIGSSGRVFPKSFKASPLLRAWLRRLENLGVQFAPRHRWTGWREGGLSFETENGEAIIKADAALLALGGASWAKLGSNGLWAEILAEKGIQLAPFRPSNCGFDIAWTPEFAAKYAGTPLKSIVLTGAGTSLRGEALMTEHGLEGGAIYALSAGLRDEIAAQGFATLHLDLRPDVTLAALTTRLSAPQKGQSTSNFLRKAANLHPVQLGLLREVFGKDIPATPEARARAIKHLPLKLLATRPIDRAISTAGGVTWPELNAHLMLSQMPGTFIAGEMLDFEAPTGGYLLQGAFSTGVLAARGMLEWVRGAIR